MMPTFWELFIYAFLVPLIFILVSTYLARRYYFRKEGNEDVPHKYTTEKKCGQCGADLIFDHTSNEGTLVVLKNGKQSIFKNAKMPFLWVYFKCIKGCDWQLCTTDRRNKR